MCYDRHFAECLSRSSCTKQVTTDMSMKNHFLGWCHQVGIPMAGAGASNIEACKFITGCYAISLVNQEALQSKKIRHVTLKGYIKMASKYQTNQSLSTPRGASMDFIKVVLDAVKK